jgi:eukaryotic-like serine/threonine-protein kinase
MNTTAVPTGNMPQAGTLRAEMEDLRAQGLCMSVSQAVSIIVPLAVEAAARHRVGELFYVHPSSVVADAYGQYVISPGLASPPPTLGRDRACMAPEARQGQQGTARATVFALGAMLYELVTGLSVGPGMRRPRELNPELPPELEIILGKALVASPEHRPDDLNALAQAVHHLAPEGTIPPPAADESHLDHDGGFDVDVSLSMMPPPPREAVSPYDLKIKEAPVARQPQRIQDDQTSELAALKTQLESDPRPRYAVIKDGMDHGPFSAVELLQQIATHTFVEDDILRDSFSREEKPIKEWPEFEPFARQARLHRDIKAEKAALEHSVVQESRSTRGKALLGVLIIGALLALAAVWFLQVRGRKSDSVAVQGETASNIETEGNLRVPKNARGGRGGGVVGMQGGIPILAGGMSCEAAAAKYVEQINVGGPKGQADITRAQYAGILNRGSYLAGCPVPGSMGVNICIAVQNGRAVGVTVTTTPRSRAAEGCVAAAVRRLSFPSNPKLDVTRTTFAPGK